MITQGNMRIMMRGPKEDVRIFLECLKEKSKGTLFELEEEALQYVDDAYVSYFSVIDNFEMFPFRLIGADTAECSVYVDHCERVWITELKKLFPEVRICAILRNDTNYAEIYSRSGSARVVMTDRRVAYRKNISFPIYAWWDKDEPFRFSKNPDGTFCIEEYYRWDKEPVVPGQWKGSAVTSIADGAFQGNPEIRKLVLPDTIREVGNRVFENCPNLVVCADDYEIQEKLKREGVMVVNSSADLDLARIKMLFSYEIEHGEARILSYKGKETYVVVPEQIEGYPVTEIGAEAFLGRETHKASVCLDRLIMPDSIRKIGRKAFYDTNLKDFHLPAELEQIEEYAFAYCQGPEKILIPDKLRSVEELRDFYHISDIDVSEENPYFSSKDGVLFNKDGSELIWYPAGKRGDSYFIGDGVKKIADRAFEIHKRQHHAGNLKIVSMSDEVTQIGEKAFCNCGNLEQVELSASLTKIGMSAFFNCIGLKEIRIPEGVREIAYGTFYMCRRLTEVSIPSGVTKIGDRSFYSCRSLTEIHLPEQLEEVGDYAFHDCQFLRRLLIPSSVKTIGREVCSQCLNLRQAVIPEGVRRIGRHTFFGCRALKEIDIPVSVTAYQDWTEENCILKLRGIPIRDISGRQYQKMAAIGYMEMKSGGDSVKAAYEKGYENYIKNNCREFFEPAFQDEHILYFLTEYEMISEEDADVLIIRANQERNTAAAAILLEYKNKISAKRSGSVWDDILGSTGWF